MQCTFTLFVRVPIFPILWTVFDIRVKVRAITGLCRRRVINSGTLIDFGTYWDLRSELEEAWVEDGRGKKSEEDEPTDSCILHNTVLVYRRGGSWQIINYSRPY